MADDIQRIIYKTEIDDSGYIRGIESMSNSTGRLTEIQAAANKALKLAEDSLRSQSQILAETKKALDSYTGSDEKYRLQLSKSFKDAQAGYDKLSGFVANSRKEYEAATKAVQDFAAASDAANKIQQQTTGGKIPTPTPPTAAPPTPSIPAALSAKIFNTVDITQFGELSEITAKTKTEFDALRDSIQLAEERMKQLNAEDEEFKQLVPVVEAGKKAIQDYDNATKAATGSQVSIRAQLRQGREELVRLEQAGQGATKQYFELEKQVARLTDEFNDQQQRIRILASDTKLLDFGKAAITAATSAFQAYSAVSILVGGQSEELQKKTMQLFAAMQLLQSIEQLSNLTRREGILSTLGLSGATKVYETVVGTATGSLKAFRVALLGTGIGAAIVAIGFLVSKYQQMRDALAEAGERQKNINDALKQAGTVYAEAVKNVNELRINIDLAKKGFIDKEKVVKEYNETIGKTTGQVKSLDEAEQALGKNAEAYIQFTLLKAAANITLETAAKKLVDAQVKQRKDEQELTRLQAGAGITAGRERGNIEEQTNKIAQEQQVQRIQNFKNRVQKENKDLLDIATDFQKQAADISKKFKFNFFQDTKEVKVDTKAVENVFAQKLKELQARLAELTAKSFESEGTIRKQFAASLDKELSAIDELVKKKQITKGQAQQLIELTIKINDVQLQTALDGFNKKIIDARKKLNDELNVIQQKNNQDQLNLIQDEFERRAALIDFNEKQEQQNAKDALQERLDALDLNPLLTDELDYENARAIIITEGEQQALNIQKKFANERQNLSADVFKKSLDQLNTILSDQLLNIDEQTAAKIQEQKRFLESGTVNYDTFQKNITQILKDQKAERDKLRLQELNDELKKIDDRLAASTNAAEREELLRRQREARSQIAQINSQTNDVTDDNKKRTETVQQYAEAVGDLTNSIISFWQKANEAESAALDRSISLQQRRVDEAQRIAERGNAQYLKQEQDRLTELNIQRENAARRQLAIDAALQASQLLVGITGAISKIASGIGAAETIAEIAIIVGALATGYGLVKSLQGNQPRLKEGTPYLQREGQPAGTDTIPAWLTEGEAVVPRETNKKYKKSVEAIYHGKVPAEVLNTFVENYVHSDKNTSLEDRKLNTVHKVVNEVSDKKLSISEIKNLLTQKKESFVDSYTSDISDRKTFNEIKTIIDLVGNRNSHDERYSQVINRVLTENKSLSTIAVIHKIVNEVLDKKIGITKLSHFVNKYQKSIDESKTINIVQKINKAVEEKLNNSISENTTITNAVNKILNIETYKQFVNNIKKIPAKILTSFVENYHNITRDHSIEKIIQSERHYFKGTPDLKGASGIDKIHILATEHEAIIPAWKNNLYKPVINAVFDGKIPAEKFNSFVREYHTVKPVPQLNYERIKETAETHINHDSKLSALLQEQNILLKENNALQLEILKKKTHIENTIDRNGVSSMVYEWAEQRRKDKRT